MDYVIFGFIFIISASVGKSDISLHQSANSHKSPVSFGGDTPANEDDLLFAASSVAGAIHDDGQYHSYYQSEQFDIRNNIPGEPDVDYPIYSTPPVTSFTCHNRDDGYYADVEARCQVFRVCANTDLTGKGFAFLCPNGTLFNQKVFVCDWYHNVDCPGSVNYYSKNAEMNKRFGSISDMIAAVQDMVDYPMKNNLKNNANDLNGHLNPNTQSPIDNRFPNVGNNFGNGLTTAATPTPQLFHTTPPNAFQSFPLFPTTPQFNTDNFGNRFPNNLPTTLNPLFQQTHPPLVPISPVTQSPALVNHFQPESPNNGNGNLVQPHNNLTPSQPLQNNVGNVNPNAGITSNVPPPQAPVYVNSLGELSTDYGDKFDLNKVQVLNASPSLPTTLPKTTSPTPDPRQVVFGGEGDLLGHTLTNSRPGDNVAQVNQLGTIAVFSGEGDLLSQSHRGHQKGGQGQDLFGTKLIQSGEGDLLGQTLQNQRPGQQQGGNDFSSKPVFSGEGDLLSQKLRDQNRGQPDQGQNEFGIKTIESGEGDLLSQLHRNQQQGHVPQGQDQFGTKRIESGEGDLLSQLHRNQQQGHVPQGQDEFGNKKIESGEGDLLSQTLRNQHKGQNQDQFGTKTIESGEGDLLSQTLRNQHNGQGQDQFGTKRIESGEGDLLSQLHRNQQQGHGPQEQDEFGNKKIESGEGDLLSQTLRNQHKGQNQDQFGTKTIESGEGDLLSQTLRNQQHGHRHQGQDEFGNKKIESGEGDLLSQTLRNQHKGQNQDQFGTKTIESGEGDLLSQTLRNQQQGHRHQGPDEFVNTKIESGEGDLLSQTLRNQHKGQDQFGTKKIESGEGDLLSQLHRNQQQGQRPQEQDEFGNKKIESGEGDLLSQTLRNQHKGQGNGNNNDEFITRTTQSGEGDLLSKTLQNQHNGPKTIQSGEVDLLSHTLHQQNRPPVDQLSTRPVFSGEGDLLSQLNPNRNVPAQLNTPNEFGTKTIYSGEGDLLSQLHRQQQPVNQHNQIGSKAVYSGEGDLLSHGLPNQPLSHPVDELKNKPTYPGEGNLLNQLVRGQQGPQTPGPLHTQAVYSGEKHLQGQNVYTSQNAGNTDTNLNDLISQIFDTQNQLLGSPQPNQGGYTYTPINTHTSNIQPTVGPSQPTTTESPPTIAPKQIFTYPQNDIQTDQSYTTTQSPNYYLPVPIDISGLTAKNIEAQTLNQTPSADKATNLLFRGLQLYLYENDNANIVDPNGNDQIDQNDYLLPPLVVRTQTDSNEQAIVETQTESDASVTLLKAKLVKELQQQSGYLNNSINLQYLPVPLPIPSDPIGYKSGKTQEKRHDKNYANHIDNDNNDDDKDVSATTKILIKKPFKKLQKEETADIDDIDIRFNADSEEAAPSTQRQVIDQKDSATLKKFIDQYLSPAVHYATIENLPRTDSGFTHPPLRAEYPTELQNNFIPKARIAYQPTTATTNGHFSSSPPPVPPAVLPTALPPVAQSSPAIAPNRPQYYQGPIITSTYSNRDTPASSAADKVVVKIVPATGWYLNDENERRSYYDALSHGLLKENGYVFVNDVQRDVQPIEHNAIRRSPQTFQYQNYQPYINYYQTAPVYAAQTQRVPTERSFSDDDAYYHGHTSFNVPLNSVTRLAGDSNTVPAYQLVYNNQRTRRRSQI